MTTNGAIPVSQELTHDECLELLARNDVGRLAVTLEDGQPDVFPVNYRLDGDRIVFRSLSGTKLSHAALNKVAFEVDERSEAAAMSVVVKGVGREITDALDPASERQRHLELGTLLRGDHWVRIVPAAITGRRVAVA